MRPPHPAARPPVPSRPSRQRKAACGTGTMVVGQYAGNPGGTTPLVNATTYFDAAGSASNAFSSVTATDCRVQSGDELEW